jgi:signal transduction histidine kinase/DNA-binding response OmpR family regulator
VILIADTLPDGHGQDLLIDIRRQGLAVAVVMLVNPDDDTLVINALKAGADDYVVSREGYLQGLSTVLEMALARFRVETERKASPIRVLYIEPSLMASHQTAQHLTRYGSHIQLESIQTVSEGLECLSVSHNYDVLLLHDQISNLVLLDLLKTLRQERREQISIVLMIQPGQEEFALQGLRLGASSYIVKHPGYLFRLPTTLENAYRHAQVQRERAALHLSEAAEREQRQIIEALRDSVAALTDSLDVDTVMGRFLEYAGRVVSYDTASIILFEGDTARVAYWRNFSAEAEGFFRDYRFSMSATKFQVARENQQPYLIADTTLSPQWVPSPFATWVRSSIGIPIRGPGGVIGLLAVDSALPNHFKPVDVERLQTFAHYASAALENAHLHADLKQYANNLEQKNAERTAELDREQAQLHAIMDAMGEGVVYITLPETRIEYYNSSFSTLTGYTFAPENRTHVLLNEVFIGVSEDTLNDLVSTLQKNEKWHGDLEMRHHQSQSLITIALTGAPLRGTDEKPIGAVLLVRDVSQQKALQSQKDRFIANAAHELRTPMTLIINRLYLMRRLPDRSSTHLEQLEDAIQHMKNLVDSLLDLSRFEWDMITLMPTRTHLQTLVSTILAHQQLLAEQKHIQLVTDFAPEPIYADVDVTRIRQLLDNLIINAMNHTSQGNTITVRLHEERDEVVIQVEDTGIGIPSEDIPRLFEPFYRVGGSQSPGTGLGLPLSKEIVDLHKGQINVVSQVGKGTTIVIRLPIHAASDA